MTTVGYIGLGLMGAPIARNLMKAGHTLVVHNRSRAIVDQLVAEGARAAFSPREVAAQVEIVFTNLPDSPDVEQVALGPDGIIEGAHPGLIFIDNSTIKPETARRIATELAKVGIAALAAPVSGGDVGAKAGTLAIMVGGEEAAFQTALPVLQAMGKTITHIGASGAGQVTKAANQIMVVAQMLGMAEALVLSQKAGSTRSASCRPSAGARPNAGRWIPNPSASSAATDARLQAHMQHKDLNIVLDTGNAYGIPLPLTALAQQLYRAMLAAGNGHLDNSAVITVLEALAGVTVGKAE